MGKRRREEEREKEERGGEKEEKRGGERGEEEREERREGRREMGRRGEEEKEDHGRQCSIHMARRNKYLRNSVGGGQPDQQLESRLGVNPSNCQSQIKRPKETRLSSLLHEHTWRRHGV